jgi:Phage integrase family
LPAAPKASPYARSPAASESASPSCTARSQPPRPTLSPSADGRNCLVSHIRPIFGEYYGDPFYAGLRLGETLALDLADVQLSARKGTLIVRSGKGDRYREIPTHPTLRTNLAIWIDDERPHWSGAQDNPALLLNRRGGRLSARAADQILGQIANDANIEEFTPTSCATPSAPDSSAKATTWSSSPNSSDTRALIKHVATACPPKPTANEPSTACSPTTDQRQWPGYTYLVATRTVPLGDTRTGAKPHAARGELAHRSLSKFR